MNKISQIDVYDFLKKNKGVKFNRMEIAKELDLNEGTICKNLLKLLRSNSINRSWQLVEYTTKKISKDGKIISEKFKKIESIYWY